VNHIPANGVNRQRNRLFCRISLWIALGLAAYQVLWTYWLAGVNIPDYEVDKVTGQKRIRRRPEHLKKHDHFLGVDVPT
jgi:hypothetical protein